MRNIQCKHYEFCLSIAAIKDRKVLPCGMCIHRGNTEGSIDAEADLSGCLALLLRTYCGVEIVGSQWLTFMDWIHVNRAAMLSIITGDRRQWAPELQKVAKAV